MSVANEARTRAPGRLVRRGLSADYPAVREVVSAAYSGYRRFIPPEILPAYFADLLDIQRHARHGRLVVAELGGRISGSASFYRDISEQGLGWPAGWAGGRGMAVHPDASGQGIATALLGEFERLSRRIGAPVFAFHTASFMTGAIALYNRLGYRRAPEFDLDLNAYYGTDGAWPMSAIAYRRDLI